jgi:hypothetical protein
MGILFPLAPEPLELPGLSDMEVAAINQAPYMSQTPYASQIVEGLVCK